MMKWCLVIAGIKDLGRPPEKLSVGQNVALAATGMIWVRYSLVITPVNYSLAAVNFFVGATGIAQLARIYNHQQQVKGGSVTAAIADAAKDAKSATVNAAQDAKAATIGK